MGKINASSQITFLYVDDLDKAAEFFSDDLGLDLVYDPGWSKVWRASGQAFVGAVETKSGSIPITVRGGFLISLTVDNAESVHHRLSKTGKYNLSEVKMVKDIGLKSFFFKGPEGYDFEIQEFTDPALKSIF